MKRDMNLIKRIVEFIETLEPGSSANDSSFTVHLGLEKEYDRDTILCHIGLLEEEKFIIGKVERSDFSATIKSIDIFRLTWKGHDLLDSLRK